MPCVCHITRSSDTTLYAASTVLLTATREGQPCLAGLSSICSIQGAGVGIPINRGSKGVAAAG